MTSVPVAKVEREWEHVHQQASVDNIDAVRAAVTKQGNHVRQLKKDGAPQDQITEGVNHLKELKEKLAELEKLAAAKDPPFNRAAMDDLLKRRMFVVPSFEIYGGLAGFFDFGPPACALKQNIIDVWRKHFVLEENMLEVECTSLTMEKVLKVSGHVDKFTDLMVKDAKSGECFRADKLLEDHIDNLINKTPTMTEEERTEHRKIALQADAFTPAQLGEQLKAYGIKSPTTGNELSSPFPFNLMFQTTIGAEGNHTGYLRPETAQGIFINFSRLLDYNNGRLPFAAAQIGSGYRNEISPRSGLLRVREFTMAEIEHFVHPENKKHAKFSAIADLVVTLFPSDKQLSDGKTIEMNVGKAVKDGIIDNETLGYFLARTQQFCLKIGIHRDKIRFRQHLPTEMAHYACDCWDLEIKLSYGWIECAGHADRSCYDLKVHSQASGKTMNASLRYDAPRKVETVTAKINKGVLGREFKTEQKAVVAALEDLAANKDAALAFDKELKENGSATLTANDGKEFNLRKEHVEFVVASKMALEEKFLPSVVEPSFGIGRILYAALEHSFYMRENDEKRGVMSFAPLVAPIKCAVFPLSANKEFEPLVNKILADLTAAGVSNRSDSSSVAIGRRYARVDELGVPFAITVDFDSVKDETVTLRERDTMSQVRLHSSVVPALIRNLYTGAITWEAVTKKYPIVRVEEGESEAATAAATSSLAAMVIEDTGRGKFYRPASKKA